MKNTAGGGEQIKNFRRFAAILAILHTFYTYLCRKSAVFEKSASEGSRRRRINARQSAETSAPLQICCVIDAVTATIAAPGCNFGLCSLGLAPCPVLRFCMNCRCPVITASACTGQPQAQPQTNPPAPAPTAAPAAASSQHPKSYPKSIGF